MRLRPSKFVFLLLLACTVQLGEACALTLITVHSLQNASAHDVTVIGQSQVTHRNRTEKRHSHTFRLGSRATVAERTPWTMPHPALASAAITSFTGLLRA